MSLPYSLPPAFTNEPRQDIPLNNKDALIKRLNDVVLSLSKDPGTGLNDSTLTAIYSEVDHIEHLLNNEEKRPECNEGQDPEDLQTATNAEENLLQSSLALIKESRMSTETTPHSPNPPPRPAPSMTISRAMEIANAAEELASQLTSSIEELQKRREESEHIHSLLITRAEKAAERIIYLESRISEMEDDFESNQSELRFLRIQLKAIEAQCSQSVPRDEDEELSRSIMNWKGDWEDIDRRSKARRVTRSALLANVRST